MTYRKRALGALAASALALPLLASPASAAPGDTTIPPARGIGQFCINPSTSQFSDVLASGDSNANELALAVRCLATADIANGGAFGNPPTTYSPELNVTRGQMASFIARTIDASVARETAEAAVRELPAPSASNPFRDVPNNDIHINNIKRLTQAGIVQGNPGTAQQPNGIGADRYGPELSITRGQMASFINRAVAFIEGGDPRQAGSSDANGFAAPNAEFYTDELQQIHARNINGITSAGIARGVGDKRYDSLGNVTRRQMARFLARTLATLNLPAGDQRILVLRELFTANFSDDDRDSETRLTSADADAPTEANSREYLAEGLRDGVEYRITLVETEQAERLEPNNEVQFETESVEGRNVVNTGGPDARISAVNRDEPRNNMAAGTATTGTGGQTPTAVAEAENGSISFAVRSDVPEDVVPVLYVNGGGDQTSFQTGGGDVARLETDDQGRPTEFYGVAGEVRFVAGPGTGPSPSPEPEPEPVDGQADVELATDTAAPGDSISATVTADQPIESVTVTGDCIEDQTFTPGLNDDDQNFQIDVVISPDAADGQCVLTFEVTFENGTTDTVTKTITIESGGGGQQGGMVQDSQLSTDTADRGDSIMATITADQPIESVTVTGDCVDDQTFQNTDGDSEAEFTFVIADDAPEGECVLTFEVTFEDGSTDTVTETITIEAGPRIVDAFVATDVADGGMATGTANVGDFFELNFNEELATDGVIATQSVDGATLTLVDGDGDEFVVECGADPAVITDGVTAAECTVDSGDRTLLTIELLEDPEPTDVGDGMFDFPLEITDSTGLTDDQGNEVNLNVGDTEINADVRTQEV